MSGLIFLIISLIINYTQTVFVQISEYLTKKEITVENYYMLVYHVAGAGSANICRFFIILLQWGNIYNKNFYVY